MSDVRLCKQCGGMFRYTGDSMCPKCQAKMDEYFLEVRDYLDAHPNAGVKEILENTEIDEKSLLRMLRDGRFQLTTPDGSILCDKCGRPIVAGRMCEDCRKKLEKALSVAAASMKPKEAPKPARGGTDRSKGMHINVTD